MSGCTCYVTDPKTWTVCGSAVEPGSMWEPNPDCPEHFPAVECYERHVLAPGIHQGVPHRHERPTDAV